MPSTIDGASNSIALLNFPAVIAPLIVPEFVTFSPKPLMPTPLVPDPLALALAVAAITPLLRVVLFLATTPLPPE